MWLNGDISRDEFDNNWCLPCNSSFIKFGEKTITSVVYITNQRPVMAGTDDNRRLITPVLRLFDGEMMDPCGFIDTDVKRHICSIDYRNALQISAFLSKGLSEEYINFCFEATKTENGTDSVWGKGSLYGRFDGGISMKLNGASGFMKTYDIVFSLEESIMKEYRIYNAPLETIEALRDVIRSFALNRHVYYYEWLQTQMAMKILCGKESIYGKISENEDVSDVEKEEG